jgi:hypothetical protein
MLRGEMKVKDCLVQSNVVIAPLWRLATTGGRPIMVVLT